MSNLIDAIRVCKDLYTDFSFQVFPITFLWIVLIYWVIRWKKECTGIFLYVLTSILLLILPILYSISKIKSMPDAYFYDAYAFLPLVVLVPICAAEVYENLALKGKDRECAGKPEERMEQQIETEQKQSLWNRFCRNKVVQVITFFCIIWILLWSSSIFEYHNDALAIFSETRAEEADAEAIYDYCVESGYTMVFAPSEIASRLRECGTGVTTYYGEHYESYPTGDVIMILHYSDLYGAGAVVVDKDYDYTYYFYEEDKYTTGFETENYVVYVRQ